MLIKFLPRNVCIIVSYVLLFSQKSLRMVHTLGGRNRKDCMERLLTAKDVSERLHCSQKRNDYIYELVSEGKIKGAKFGNKWLFKESDVEDFIEKQFEMQNKKTFI